jgi:hypothetical protein
VTRDAAAGFIEVTRALHDEMALPINLPPQSQSLTQLTTNKEGSLSASVTVAFGSACCDDDRRMKRWHGVGACSLRLGVGSDKEQGKVHLLFPRPGGLQTQLSQFPISLLNFIERTQCCFVFAELCGRWGGATRINAEGHSNTAPGLRRGAWGQRRDRCSRA